MEKIFNFVKKNAKIITILTAFIGLFIAADFFEPGIIGVVSQERELPIYSVDASDKAVSLTFDCAWGASDISSILETLKKENVQATFFLVGQWAEKYPEYVKMIASEGHDVANHSYSHLRMGSISSNNIKEDIAKCNNLIEELTGKKNDLFRAPYGDYNDNVIRTAKNMGLYSIQWDVDSLDWKPEISQEEMLSRIVTKIQKGSIILMHNDTRHTAQTLPMIISSIKRNGYSFLPVSKLIMRENYMIDVDGRQKTK